MTVKDYLLSLKKAGHLSRLSKLGYLSPKASIWLEMWLHYDAVRRGSDHPEGEVIGQVSKEFRCSRATVYRMLVAFERPMKEN